MIATAVSAQNRCYYCMKRTAPRCAISRAIRSWGADGDELPRRAPSTSASARCSISWVKLTAEPWLIEDADREALRRAGFSDRDIWDIAAVAAFYNMTNRLASATDMRPNSQYHAQGR
jgi:uncharacterized peroxidase-related enzyme